jgi:hypothetical protein
VSEAAPVAPTRSCGECRLCCKVMGIYEQGTGPDGVPYGFSKAAFRWCRHSGPSGCALHGTAAKPWSCRTYECEWLSGMGGEQDRPDRARVVVTLEADASFGTAGQIALLYCADPSQHRSDAVKRLLQLVAQRPDVTACAVVTRVGAPIPCFVRSGPHAGRAVFLAALREGEAVVDADEEQGFMRELFGGEIPEPLGDGTLRTRLALRTAALAPADFERIFAPAEPQPRAVVGELWPASGEDPGPKKPESA